MIAVLLVIHVMLAIALVGTVLVQRSEGGGLGIGGGGGMSGLMTGRATANFLTRATAILAALFMTTSLTLAFLAGHGPKPKSIFEGTPSSPLSSPLNAPLNAPLTPPAGTTGAAPATPAPPTAGEPTAPAPAQEQKPAPPLAH